MGQLNGPLPCHSYILFVKYLTISNIVMCLFPVFIYLICKRDTLLIQAQKEI